MVKVLSSFVMVLSSLFACSIDVGLMLYIFNKWAFLIRWVQHLMFCNNFRFKKKLRYGTEKILTFLLTSVSKYVRTYVNVSVDNIVF